VPFFTNLDFLHNPLHYFILLSYVEAYTVVLVDLCYVSPSLELRTHYHPGVEMFIDDETREANG
jgi:hypothetical protein